MVESLWRSFPPLVVGIFASPYLLVLLSYTICKDKKMKSRIDPTFSFPWRRTHPMAMSGKAKNVRIIIRHLPTKAWWWDSTLPLQSFSHRIALVSSLYYIDSRLDLLSLPSLVFNKMFTISEWTSWQMPSRETNSDLATRTLPS